MMSTYVVRKHSMVRFRFRVVNHILTALELVRQPFDVLGLKVESFTLLNCDPLDAIHNERIFVV